MFSIRLRAPQGQGLMWQGLQDKVVYLGQMLRVWVRCCLICFSIPKPRIAPLLCFSGRGIRVWVTMNYILSPPEAQVR